MPGRIQRGPGGGAFGQQAPLTMADYRAVAANAPFVSRRVGRFQRARACSRYGDKTSEVNVTGVLPNFTAIRNWTTRPGRFVDESDNGGRSRVVVLGQTVADRPVRAGRRPDGQGGAHQQRAVPRDRRHGDRAGRRSWATRMRPPSSRLARRRSGCSSSSPCPTTGDRIVSTIYLQSSNDAAAADRRIRGRGRVLRERRRIPEDEPSDFSVVSQDRADQHLRRGHRRADGVPGRHRGHLAAGGRHRHHEHHAGQRDRAHARDRPAQSHRRQVVGHPQPVPDRGDVPVFARRRCSASPSASASRSWSRDSPTSSRWSS